MQFIKIIIITFIFSINVYISISQENAILHPDKEIFEYSDIIKINYKNLPGNYRDWIAITPVDAPDNFLKNWAYTKGKKTGVYEIKNIGYGDFEARLYYKWPKGDYNVKARCRFKIKSPTIKEKKKEIVWLPIEKAIELSKKDNKPIFIDIYTRWCHYCKVMDKKIYNKSKVINYLNNNFHSVKLNAEAFETIYYFDNETSAMQLVSEVFKIRAYPTIILINNRGQTSRITGYKSVSKLLHELKKYNKKITQ